MVIVSALPILDNRVGIVNSAKEDRSVVMASVDALMVLRRVETTARLTATADTTKS